MSKMLRSFFIVSFLLCGTYSHAQDKVQMADVMRSNGKIYVVVAVCLTILIGLFIYVFALDKKITSLERKNNHAEL